MRWAIQAGSLPPNGDFEENTKPGGAGFACQPRQFAVISNLPIKRLTRATRKGQSELAAEQGSFAAKVHSIAVCWQRGFP
jgi:hypothetical protein